MIKGPLPPPSFRPPADEPEVQGAPPERAAAQPSASMPETSTPAGRPPHVHPEAGGRPPPPRPPRSAATGTGTPINGESVPLPERPPEPAHVRELRARYERIVRQRSEAEERAPELGRAVNTSRALAKGREVSKILDPGEESTRLAAEARDLLQRAIEAETTSLHELENLRVAESRARAELEAAVEAAAKDDERHVLRALDATHDQDAADLRRALDRLFLRSRLRGLQTHAQALVGATLGLAASGEAMVQRSGQLYRQILQEAGR